LALLEKFPETVTKNLIFIVTITWAVPDETTSMFSTFDELSDSVSKRLDDSVIKAQSIDPATIVFTSGTTGAPKGVLYTHEQVVLACSSILNTFDDINIDSNLVCWLPLSNLFQRIVNICAISSGASTYFIENPRDLIPQLTVINPHLLIGVPRFFEKVHEGITAEIRKKTFLVRKVIDWAISVGADNACALRMMQELGFLKRICYRVADFLILNRIRSIVGKKLKFFVSGSAPMPIWLLEWFHAIGIVVLEAYGTTENIIPIAMNRPHSFKFGTVGTTLPGNEVVIAEDGELLVKGKGVFHGYHQEETQNSPLLTNGYLATGDYAEIERDGFITLKGRKSEIFKTSTGHRIAPVGIESCLRRIAYVENAVVFGAGRKFPIALVSIAIDALPRYFQAVEPLSGKDGPKLHPNFLDSIRTDLEEELAPLPQHQRPAGIVITTDPFTIAGGELTANLKLRRKNVEQKYQVYLERMYREMEKSGRNSELFIDCV
ncbi:MAG: AMP-binding protein, partial [Geobacteraceae bacterium]|nr:AMP-binding protein [Geobacteraceae bacterium]